MPPLATSRLFSFSPRRAAGWVGLLALLGLCLSHPARAQRLDVGYTLAPTAERLYATDEAALQSGFLYGGDLGLSLGQLVQLRATYRQGNSLNTDFSAIEGLLGLPNRSVDLQRFGGALRLNLGTQEIVPYLTLGTGLLRIDPGAPATTTNVYASGGAGLTLNIQNRYRLSVGGTVLSYRYDPVTTFIGAGAGTVVDAPMQMVYQPALEASLALYLGGRSPSAPTAIDQAVRAQFGNGLSDLRLYVNPFYGRIEFNDALGLPKDQNVAGLSAGVEFGPYVGLRAFYWRGTTGNDLLDDFAGGFQAIQFYGSELKLRLDTNIGRGFVPFLLIGGGYMDVMGGYADALSPDATVPSDRFFGTGGIGLEVPLTESIKLSGTARSLLMSAQGAADVTRPEDVFGSLAYSFGLAFRLGDETPAPRPQPQPLPPPGGPAQRPDARRPPPPAARNPILARLDSLEQLLRQRQPAGTYRDTVQTPAAPASNLSDRTLQIPVPEVGEIYIRIGDARRSTVAPTVRVDTSAVVAADNVGAPGTLTADEIAQAVQQALRRQAPQAPTDSAQQMTPAQVRQIAQQVVRSLTETGARAAEETRPALVREQEIARLREEIEALRQRLRQQDEDIAEARREPPTVAEAAPQTEPTEPFYRSILGVPLLGVMPVTGVRAGTGPTHFQVGVRGDYREAPTSRFRLLPEVVLGLGPGSKSLSVVGNAAVGFASGLAQRYTGQDLRPYVGAGLGFASRSGLDFRFVVNLMLGTEYRVPGTEAILFGELSTYNFFDTGRFTLGYRFDL